MKDREIVRCEDNLKEGENKIRKLKELIEHLREVNDNLKPDHVFPLNANPNGGAVVVLEPNLRFLKMVDH
jgi:hypothetical protein